MEENIVKCLSVIYFIHLIAITSSYSQNEDEASRIHLRGKRQQSLKEYKEVECNRTIWKALAEPYLNAERNLQLYPTNSEYLVNFEDTLVKFKNWSLSNPNPQHLHEVCFFRFFLECSEKGKCVCGAGEVPYSYEKADGDFCLGKRGTVCLTDKDCIPGLMCQEKYCGGSAAFKEEVKHSSSTWRIQKSITTLLISLSILIKYTS